MKKRKIATTPLGRTNFVKIHFVENHKDDQKQVVYHFVKNTFGVSEFFVSLNPKACLEDPRSASALGDERAVWGVVRC